MTKPVMESLIARARVLGCLLALTFLGLNPAAAQGDVPWALLKQPGVHAIMRHALAPGTGDPADFRLDDCDTQRNLDARGRQQARAIGQALRDAGIRFDRVLTSQWCRCRETATLLQLGPPEDFATLNSFFADRSTQGRQTDELRAFLASLPDTQKVMLVTHQVNITALTGRGVGSGEVFLIKHNADGTITVVDTFLIAP